MTISNAHDFHPGIATAAHSTIHFDGVFLQPLVLRNNDPTTQSGQGHKENLMGSWAGSWLALKLPGPGLLSVFKMGDEKKAEIQVTILCICTATLKS